MTSVPAFLECVADIRIKISSYLQNIFTLVSENFGMFSLYFCQLKSNLKRMNKSQILDFIAFYKLSQLLWNWGCNMFYI